VAARVGLGFGRGDAAEEKEIGGEAEEGETGDGRCGGRAPTGRGGRRGVGGARGVSDVCLVWVYDDDGVGRLGFASATQPKFNDKAGSTVNSDRLSKHATVLKKKKTKDATTMRFVQQCRLN